MVGFVKEAQSKRRALDLPKSVEVVWGGQFENFNRAKARLSMLVPVSIGVIALMLVFMFRNMKYMLITLANLPFARRRRRLRADLARAARSAFRRASASSRSAVSPS